MWFVPDGCQAFFNGEVVVDLIPIPGMTHVRKIEPFVSDVCHYSEPDFECLFYDVTLTPICVTLKYLFENINNFIYTLGHFCRD